MKKDRGQAIVILAFALLALAAFAGLAIDGGRTYSTRRQAQNTSDAAAMAGTRLLAQYVADCSVVDREVADNEIALAMMAIIRDNGINPLALTTRIDAWYVNAAETRLREVGRTTAGVPDGATGIEAGLTVTDSTTFLKIVGQPHLVASGDAMAMSGPVVQFGGGILPIGVPLEVVTQLDLDDEFYVMKKTNEHEGGTFCRDPEGTMCIGDYNDANAHRGWLNLNYIYNTAYIAANDQNNRSFLQNVSADRCGNEPTKSVDDGLQGWAGDDKDHDGEADCPYPFPIFAGTPERINGDFIHGDPGARETALMDVKSTYSGELVYVPIFDHIYASDYMETYFTAPESPVPDGNLGGNHWPRGGGGGSAFLYHIVGFTAVQLNDVNTGQHELVGEFKGAIIGDGQIQPGAGFGSGSGGSCNSLMLIGVQLWH